MHNVLEQLYTITIYLPTHYSIVCILYVIFFKEHKNQWS